MKAHIVLLVLLNSVLTGFAQRGLVIDSRETVVIREMGDSAGFEAKMFSYEVKEFVFDSCNYSANSFSVIFQIRNQTTHPFIGGPASFISWYDAVGFRGKSSEPLIIKPDETKTVILEIVPYHRTRMENRGMIFGQWNGKELELPLLVRFFPTSKSCK